MGHFNSECGSNDLLNELISSKLNSNQEHLFDKQYFKYIIK